MIKQKWQYNKIRAQQERDVQFFIPEEIAPRILPGTKTTDDTVAQTSRHYNSRILTWFTLISL
jgi:hypothetical protein